jgi:uncharacterized protein (DUF1800 family)
MVSRRQLLGGCGVAVGLNAADPAWAFRRTPLDAQERALHALNRLAYGARPEDMAAIRSEGASAWLERFIAQQLDPRSIAVPAALQARLDALDTLGLSQSDLLARFRKVVQAATSAQQRATPAADGGASTPTEDVLASARREFIRPVVLQAAHARLARAIDSPAQLQEVLVEFWFNHFNVFVGKGPVSVLAGAYERDAIRPFVLGRFRDMLGATAKHPAMLLYLDNALSVKAGYRAPAFAQANPNATRLSGLNENYARELMELHTLGVDGGYTQHDVTELARIFTGWTVDQRAARWGTGGSLFVFDPGRHDNGSKQWLGHRIDGAGQAEGEMALDVLAAHPSTARHVAYKLAQAFVADDPPPTLVQRLSDRFVQTGGDLRAVVQALISADEFWDPAMVGAKFKTPYQYLTSSLRALGVTTPQDVLPLTQVLAQAGMPLYGAQTPDGYKNVASAWMNPEAIAQRVQYASALAQRRVREGARVDIDAQRLMETLGPTLGDTTRQTVATEPGPTRLALLLASPDFMKR